MTNVTARHIDDANRNLRKARSFHRFQRSQSTAMVAYAKLAGEFAAYSGLSCSAFVAKNAEACSVDEIWHAFVASWLATTEMLRAAADLPEDLAELVTLADGAVDFS